jgi:hypothetical protein
MKCSSDKLFTAPQEAAILRLYVQQCLPSPETARRLRLPLSRVVQFMRQRGVLRHQGGPGIPRKISLEARRRLESELPTTRDVILARKYGVSKELVRQIRQGLGYPSSRVLRHKLTLRAQAERREQQKLARELRQKEQRKFELMAIKRLSARWKSGVTVSELAKEHGVSWGCLTSRIVRWRERYPQKFPYRRPAHNRDL